VTIKEKFVAWLAAREVRKQAQAWLERSLGRPLKKGESQMLNALIGNWKTSLLGIVMAALQLHQGGMSWQSALMAALMAALGFAAKDSTTGSPAIPK
jgi:hydrogenase-4 membrane subunit HyfE